MHSLRRLEHLPPLIKFTAQGTLCKTSVFSRAFEISGEHLAGALSARVQALQSEMHKVGIQFKSASDQTVTLTARLTDILAVEFQVSMLAFRQQQSKKQFRKASFLIKKFLLQVSVAAPAPAQVHLSPIRLLYEQEVAGKMQARAENTKKRTYLLSGLLPKMSMDSPEFVPSNSNLDLFCTLSAPRIGPTTTLAQLLTPFREWHSFGYKFCLHAAKP
jgi:hypothetical protein